jgi:hypothetical protein
MEDGEEKGARCHGGWREKLPAAMDDVEKLQVPMELDIKVQVPMENQLAAALIHIASLPVDVFTSSF